MRIHYIIYAQPLLRLLPKTLTHGPRRNATFSGFKIWLFPTSRDIFWGHRDCSQVNQNRKISVLSKLDKEKQMALKHEFSALNYNLYYPRTKKWGTGIVLDPRTTNQLPFLLLVAQKLGSRKASAP